VLPGDLGRGREDGVTVFVMAAGTGCFGDHLGTYQIDLEHLAERDGGEQ